MKQLLLFFLLLPLAVSAQLEVGVNAGSVIDASASYRLFNLLKIGAGFEINNNLQLSYQFGPNNPHLSTPFVFIEGSKDFGRHELYAGVHTGFGSFDNSYMTAFYGTAGKVQYYGAHVGYSFRIIKGLCANAQVGYSYYSLKVHRAADFWHNETSVSNSLSYIPVTVGVHYKLPIGKKSK